MPMLPIVQVPAPTPDDPDALEQLVCWDDAAKCWRDEHDWRWVKDWMGDPTIPNGTCDLSGYECHRCGATECDIDPPPEEAPGPPDDYDPRDYD